MPRHTDDNSPWSINFASAMMCRCGCHRLALSLHFISMKATPPTIASSQSGCARSARNDRSRRSSNSLSGSPRPHNVSVMNESGRSCGSRCARRSRIRNERRCAHGKHNRSWQKPALSLYFLGALGSSECITVECPHALNDASRLDDCPVRFIASKTRRRSTFHPECQKRAFQDLSSRSKSRASGAACFSSIHVENSSTTLVSVVSSEVGEDAPIGARPGSAVPPVTIESAGVEPADSDEGLPSSLPDVGKPEGVSGGT